jgi:hypothetical protein
LFFNIQCNLRILQSVAGLKASRGPAPGLLLRILAGAVAAGIGFGLAAAPLFAQIRTPIDETQKVSIERTATRIPAAAVDLGRATSDFPLQHLLLLLKASPSQDASLSRLIDAQQDKNSTSYHQWLTPQQFGRQYGASPADIAAVTSWL